MRYVWKCGLLTVLVLQGCSSVSSEEVPDRESGLTSAESVPDVTVSVTGFGSIRVGQELADIEAAFPESVDVSDYLGECAYMSLMEWPEGVLAMVVEGRVVRIEVWNAAIATQEGARVGMTENDIIALYPGKVEVGPHKYTDGHYVTVTPAASNEADHRIIFETDGEVVQRYRAGILPAVEWVEGCA